MTDNEKKLRTAINHILIALSEITAPGEWKLPHQKELIRDELSLAFKSLEEIE